MSRRRVSRFTAVAAPHAAATAGLVVGPPASAAPPLVVSLTFDDGLSSQHRLLPLLAEHDASATFYINSGTVGGGPGTMTWAQVHDLADAGHDVGGHGFAHLSLLDPNTSIESKWAEVCQDRETLFEQGFNPVSYAYPFGDMDPSVEEIPRGCGYQSARKAGTITTDGPIYRETIPPSENNYGIRIHGRSGDGPETLEALQAAVNAAIANGGGWLPFLFHQICYTDDPGFQACMDESYRPVSDATLDAFLTWLAPLPDTSVQNIAQVLGGTNAPRVAVTTPTAGTLNEQPVVLSGTSSVAGTITVRLYRGNRPVFSGTPPTGEEPGSPTSGWDPAPFLSTTATASGGTWSTTLPADLDAGTWTAQASAGSGNGTGTSTPVTFSVNAPPPDTTAPEPTITAPAPGATLSSDTPEVRGTAGTAPGDAGTVTVRWFEGPTVNDDVVITTEATVETNGSWSSTPPAPLADGTWTVQAVQADAAGNVGTSGLVTFTVRRPDTTPPTPRITAPAVGAEVAEGAVTIRGTAGTAPGDEAAVTVTLWSGANASGAPAWSTAAVVTDGAWAATTPALTPGSWTLRVSQRDAAGNVGTSSPITFTVSGATGRELVVDNPSATVGQGARHRRMRLTGSGFGPQTRVAASGRGVTVTVRRSTSERLVLSVDVRPRAATGARDLVVTDGGGHVVCVGCLRVAPGPKLDRVTPRQLHRRSTTKVTLHGTSFDAGTKVRIGGPGVKVRRVRLVDDQTLEVTVRVTKGAPRTARTVRVVSADTGGRDTVERAVKIRR